MGGGLMQLVAYGAQDIYLTGKPQITFFKSVYRRYTNFAVESIQQDVESTPQFGTQVVVTIARNGDLLKRLWIEYSPYDILGGINSNVLNIYDKKSYESALTDPNILPAQIGTLEKNERGAQVFKQLVTK